jgi:hypothetical protein
MAFKIEKYHFKIGSLLEGLPIKDFRSLKENIERIEIKKEKLKSIRQTEREPSKSCIYIKREKLWGTDP